MKFILLKKTIFLIVLFSLFAIVSPSQNKETFTLVVDAGHGGYDSGTTGNNNYKKYEKDVALSIALKFGRLVEKNIKNVKVVYTRKTDVFIKLVDRPKIANKNNADLFMSIHCNANNNKSINGSETYVLGPHKNKDNFDVAKKENSVIFLEEDHTVVYEGFDPNSASSIIGLTLGQEQYLESSLLLASLVQNNFKKNTALRSRGVNGVKQAGFWVLARNYMPSVLVETGFLSNHKDAKYLMSEKGKNQVAYALFLGFKEYKKYWDDQRNYGNDFVYEPDVEDEEVVKDVVIAEKVIPLAEEKEEAIPLKDTKGMVTTSTHKEEVKKAETNKGVVENKVKIEYAVQLMSSPKKISISSKSFKGLTSVSYYRTDSNFKYIYNLSSNYNAVLSSHKVVKSKGFKGSFIVAFKNGKRIPLSKALKEDKNR